jgi:hypothetical protein
VEWDQSWFVSHGSGIATRVAFQCDSAQVHASGSQRRCLIASPLPERDLDRRFQRSIDRDFGRRSQRAIRYQYRETKGRLGSRLQGVEPARLKPEALRLLVGRRRLLNVRLDEERTCVLVLIGATEDGTKELLAVVDGYRERTQSWRELLGQLKAWACPPRRSWPSVTDRSACMILLCSVPKAAFVSRLWRH